MHKMRNTSLLKQFIAHLLQTKLKPSNHKNLSNAIKMHKKGYVKCVRTHYVAFNSLICFRRNCMHIVQLQINVVFCKLANHFDEFSLVKVIEGEILL